jgi:competence protein ComEA
VVAWLFLQPDCSYTDNFYREELTRKETGMNHLSKFILLLVMLVSMQVQAESVDINTASAGVLASAIDGVGENKAASIVAYRDANGPFSSVDDLAKVRGIGAVTIDKNRDNLTVAVPVKK